MVLFDNENKNAALNEESPSFSQQSTAEQSAPEHTHDNEDLTGKPPGPETLDVVASSSQNPNTPDAGEVTEREAQPPAETEKTISDPEFHSDLRGTATPTEISNETPGTETPVAAEQQQPESTPKTEKPTTEDFASILESFETEQQEQAAAMEDRVIRGTVPSPLDWPPGCRFEPRCDYAFAKCAEEHPPLFPVDRQESACWLCEHGRRVPAPAESARTP
jgi:oligopeptide/dipeptide ABC transporter ATP-binding protein